MLRIKIITNLQEDYKQIRENQIELIKQKTEKKLKLKTSNFDTGFEKLLIDLEKFKKRQNLKAKNLKKLRLDF